MATITKTETVDIRETLPVAVKGGTASKPLWSIGDKHAVFVKPLNKKGLTAENIKPRLGSRILAKYAVDTQSPTVPGGKLWFVGMFKVVEAKE